MQALQLRHGQTLLQLLVMWSADETRCLISCSVHLAIKVSSKARCAAQAATKSGYLKEVVHRRMDASLSFFAAANLCVLLS